MLGGSGTDKPACKQWNVRVKGWLASTMNNDRATRATKECVPINVRIDDRI